MIVSRCFEGWWSQSITDVAIVRLTACLGSLLGSHRNSHLNYGGQMAELHFLKSILVAFCHQSQM